MQFDTSLMCIIMYNGTSADNNSVKSIAGKLKPRELARRLARRRTRWMIMRIIIIDVYISMSDLKLSTVATR